MCVDKGQFRLLNLYVKTDSLVKNDHFSVCCYFRGCVVLVLPVFSITEHLNKQVCNKKAVLHKVSCSQQPSSGTETSASHPGPVGSKF